MDVQAGRLRGSEIERVSGDDSLTQSKRGKIDVKLSCTSKVLKRTDQRLRIVRELVALL